jgi:hypothetical protein
MRALPALALVAAMLGAGCLSAAPVAPNDLPAAVPSPPAGALRVVHTLSGEVLDPAALGLGELFGGEYLTGLGATEPTIGVTEDGSVFMTAMRPNPTFQVQPYVPYAGFQRGPTIVRTDDKGQTFVDTFPPLPTGDSAELRTWDPYVYVDRDTGRVFMDDIYPLSCGTLSYSDDKGATWTTNPYSCGNTNVNDHQTLVTAASHGLPTVGYDKLVFRCVNNLAYVGCAVSLNGGLSFLPQKPVAEAMGNCAAITGHLDADADGNVYLPLICGNAASYAVTRDDGVSWSVVTIDTTVGVAGHDVDLAFDEAGNMYAAWTSEDLPYLAVSKDHGATWGKPAMIAPPQVTGTQFLAVAAGGPGQVTLAYVGTEVPGGFEGKPEGDCPVTSPDCTSPAEWANATWNGYLTILGDATVEDPVLQTTTANPLADPLARGYCGHSRCHGMNDFLDVVIDAEGRPWAAFVDVCTQECVADASVDHDIAGGMMGTLRAGPSLRGAAALALIPPQAPAPG